MTEPELKRCPFCGGTAAYRYNPNMTVWVECTCCFCRGLGYTDEEKAAYRWNNRAARTPEQLNQDIESVNRCINPLNLYSTKDIVKVLRERDEVVTRSLGIGTLLWVRPEKEDLCYTSL